MTRWCEPRGGVLISHEWQGSDLGVCSTQKATFGVGSRPWGRREVRCALVRRGRGSVRSSGRRVEANTIGPYLNRLFLAPVMSEEERGTTELRSLARRRCVVLYVQSRLKQNRPSTQPHPSPWSTCRPLINLLSPLTPTYQSLPELLPS